VKDPESGKMKMKNGLEDVMLEIKTMQKLDSDAVVRLHEVIDTEESNFLCMVIDFCGQGQIMDYNDEAETFTPCMKELSEFSEI
jgi:hypothetical protein